MRAAKACQQRKIVGIEYLPKHDSEPLVLSRTLTMRRNTGQSVLAKYRSKWGNMKKTYEKPILIKRQRLSHVTAQEIPSIEPQ